MIGSHAGQWTGIAPLLDRLATAAHLIEYRSPRDVIRRYEPSRRVRIVDGGYVRLSAFARRGMVIVDIADPAHIGQGLLLWVAATDAPIRVFSLRRQPADSQRLRDQFERLDESVDGLLSYGLVNARYPRSDELLGWLTG